MGHHQYGAQFSARFHPQIALFRFVPMSSPPADNGAKQAIAHGAERFNRCEIPPPGKAHRNPPEAGRIGNAFVPSFETKSFMDGHALRFHKKKRWILSKKIYALL
jgi:hypothetical protein